MTAAKQSAAAAKTTDVVKSPPAATSAVVQYDPEDVGAGFEGMTQNELTIPFLTILQKNSPQVDEEKDRYIAGSKPGMIYNTGLQEVYEGRSDGILVVPVHRDHKFVEWIPRDEGGGFAGLHEPDANPVREAQRKAGGRIFGKIPLENGNELAETFSVYVLFLRDGQAPDEAQYGVINFTSTQIKHYKRWMTRARSIVVRGENGSRVVPPLFAHVYRLRSIVEENKKGTWYGFNIDFADKTADASRLAQDNPLYQAAKVFRDLITSGAAKADFAKQTEMDLGGDGGDGGAADTGTF